MRRIKRVIKRRDLAASVVLYEPGFSEWIMVFDPVFSQIRKGDKAGTIEILDNRERFGGDEDRYREAMEATMTMLHHLGSMNRLLFQNFNNMANEVERRALKILAGKEEEKVEGTPVVELKVAEPEKGARISQADHVRAVIYALLQDPKATEHDRTYAMEELEPLLQELIQAEGRLLHGIAVAVETRLKK